MIILTGAQIYVAIVGPRHLVDSWHGVYGQFRVFQISDLCTSITGDLHTIKIFSGLRMMMMVHLIILSLWSAET